MYLRHAGQTATPVAFQALASDLLGAPPELQSLSRQILQQSRMRNLSRTVPIVGTGLNDPVGGGLVGSLARPGGNVTDVSTMAEDLQLKLIEIMREALPEVSVP